jgi:polyisoprenoid-binding protein YceI
MRPIHVLLSSLALPVLLFAAAPSGAPAAPAAPAAAAAETETYQVDAVHSFVVFNVKHMGVGYAWGRFNEMSGTIQLDTADPTKSSIALSIAAESIDTANDGRDKHLRGSDFFNVGQFPTITFTSTSVKKVEDDVFEVAGELELLGKKKPLSVQVELVGRGDKGPRGGFKAGFRTGFTIKRSDFGMKYGLDNGGLGDEVEVHVSLEGTKG